MSDRLNLPLQLDDALFVSAAFPLPGSNARRLLRGDGKLHLVETFPGQAILLVAFALYRECPFGPYAEATLALMTTHERAVPILTLKNLITASRYPAYVLHSFVNTGPAQQHGVALWKLPRQQADVRVWEQAGTANCEVTMEGRQVLRCVATRPNTDRARVMQVETYTCGPEGLLHAVMRCRAEAYGRTQGSGMTLRWGNHPIGQRLAGMGIKAQPLMMRYYDHMAAELFAPHRV